VVGGESAVIDVEIISGHAALARWTGPQLSESHFVALWDRLENHR
jgi:hypothetical protein